MSEELKLMRSYFMLKTYKQYFEAEETDAIKMLLLVALHNLMYMAHHLIPDQLLFMSFW